MNELNEQQKIELGKEVTDYISFAKKLDEVLYLEVADVILHRIQMLNQNDKEISSLVLNPVICSCSNPINSENNGNAHICGVCCKTYCNECLPVDFGVCDNCVDAGKTKEIVNDKNGEPFWAGKTLLNENSLTSSVKILQIAKPYIISDLGCVEIQDFIDAGWIVHERVTRFEVGPINDEFENCLDQCNFMPAKIGSLNCSLHDRTHHKEEPLLYRCTSALSLCRIRAS